MSGIFSKINLLINNFLDSKTTSKFDEVELNGYSAEQYYNALNFIFKSCLNERIIGLTIGHGNGNGFLLTKHSFLLIYNMHDLDDYSKGVRQLKNELNRICRNLGGYIRVYHLEEDGSTFRIFFCDNYYVSSEGTKKRSRNKVQSNDTGAPIRE